MGSGGHYTLVWGERGKCFSASRHTECLLARTGEPAGSRIPNSVSDVVRMRSSMLAMILVSVCENRGGEGEEKGSRVRGGEAVGSAEY